jgi:hypothetical protein
MFYKSKISPDMEIGNQRYSVFPRLSRFRRLPSLAFTLLISLTAFNSLVQADTTVNGVPGLTATLTNGGSYTISVTTPPWTFSGAIGSPATAIQTTSGVDGAGPYNQISFQYSSGTASIRAYTNRQSILFSSVNNAAVSNSSYFPSFVQYPAGLNHLAFQGAFAAYSFTELPVDSPWIFFDSNANTFILSPASNFMQGYLGYSTGNSIVGGIDPRIQSLPAGFSQDTLLTIGAGINSTFESWGQTLTGFTGKIRPANDAGPMLAQLGYWTSHTSAYWYQTQGSESYEQTLYNVKADLVNRGIGIGYMQLDGWSYPKGPNAEWSDQTAGIYLYEAAPALFPSGLNSFQYNLGLPLVAHAKWIDTSSPYRQQYTMSKDVIIDPAYWKSTAAYLAGAGAVSYEQDWLADHAEAKFDLTDPDLYLGAMADSMRGKHITIEYSMAVPRQFLQTARYNNVATIRCSLDGFNTAYRTPFLYTSTLAGALGVWPFADVLTSTWYGGLLLSTLSAGPVAIGDAIGTANAPNVRMAVRTDGVIVKPDVPITPLDSTFINDANQLGTPMIASSYTDFGGIKAYYVYCYPQGSNLSCKFTLSELGITGSAYVYDYSAGTGRVVSASGTLSGQITGEYIYFVIVPIGPSGIALLGDMGNFVSLGKKRIPTLVDDGKVHVSIAYASGETTRVLFGYAPAAPAVTANSGAVGSLTYNASTGLFQVAVTANASGKASVVFKP